MGSDEICFKIEKRAGVARAILAFMDAKQKSITHGSQVCKESDATTLLVIGVLRQAHARRGGGEVEHFPTICKAHLPPHTP